MSEPIKPGDKVICTDVSGYNMSHLTLGASYEVEDVRAADVKLKGVEFWTKVWRFYKVTPPDAPASTAQAEPVKVLCPTCGVDRLKLHCPKANSQPCPMISEAHAKEAASATDALTDAEIDDAVFALNAQGYTYTDDPASYRAVIRKFAATPAQATPPAHETIVVEAGELVCTACGTTAQATPEGGLQANPQAHTYPKEIWLQVGGDCDPDECAPYHELEHKSEITWCQDNIDRMDVRYVRADLAASQQAAEPVCWVNGERLHVVAKEGRDELGAVNIAGSALRTDYCDTPLYRATPPQHFNERQLIERVVTHLERQSHVGSAGLIRAAFLDAGVPK